MLTGLTFKIKQSRQVSDDNMKMMDKLTDSLSKHSDIILKEASGIDKKFHDKQAALEAANKNLAKTKRSLSEAKLHSDELLSQNKKIKDELNSSQEALSALAGDEDEADKDTSPQKISCEETKNASQKALSALAGDEGESVKDTSPQKKPHKEAKKSQMRKTSSKSPSCSQQDLFSE